MATPTTTPHLRVDTLRLPNCSCAVFCASRTASSAACTGYESSGSCSDHHHKQIAHVGSQMPQHTLACSDMFALAAGATWQMTALRILGARNAEQPKHPGVSQVCMPRTCKMCGIYSDNQTCLVRRRSLDLDTASDHNTILLLLSNKRVCTVKKLALHGVVVQELQENYSMEQGPYDRPTRRAALQVAADSLLSMA